MDQRGRRAARGHVAATSSPPSRPSAGRRAWPTGARTARGSGGCATPPSSRSTRPGSTAGVPVSVLQLVRRAAGRSDDAELLRERVADHGVEPARARRHRRRADQEPRAHPAVDDSARGVAGGRESRSRRADPARSRQPPIDAHRRHRPRVVLPAKDRFALAMSINNAAGVARIRGVDSRASRSTSAAFLRTPAGKPRVSIFSIAHLDDASGCSSSRCC